MDGIVKEFILNGFKPYYNWNTFNTLVLNNVKARLFKF